MVWLDIILDHVSEFGLKNITTLEKKYLNHYGKDTQKELEEQLNIRFDYYKSMYYYELKDAFWYDPNEWVTIDEDIIKETRLNMLWDNIEIDDCESFMKIYGVPNKFLDFDWNNVPDRHQENFENYWKSYYNFI